MMEACWPTQAPHSLPCVRRFVWRASLDVWMVSETRSVCNTPHLIWCVVLFTSEYCRIYTHFVCAVTVGYAFLPIYTLPVRDTKKAYVSLLDLINMRL